jgi:virulence-associated protein VapD
MKITTFDPLIVSPKADDVIKVFEALGFEKTHAPVTATETMEIPSVRMKNADGFHVDVADVKEMPRDNIMIRMNVDNFEEAYEILTAHGFKNTRGDGTLETKSATEATMVSPSGFMIALVKHNKT